MSADDRPAEPNQTTDISTTEPTQTTELRGENDISTTEPTQTTEIGNVDVDHASYVAADRVSLSNAPENPIRFADLTEQERPFIEVALDRGWVCRAGNTEAWEAFTERVFARRYENQYLKRDETYYGLFVVRVDQVFANTADYVDEAERSC
jgi:hypothetical protein